MVGDQDHDPAALPSGKPPMPVVEEAWSTPGSVYTGKEKNKFLPPTEVLTPDRSVCREFL